MTPSQFLVEVMLPAAGWLEPLVGVASPPAALVLLGAVAAQESGLVAPVQDGGGPARGWWQFEPAGVDGLLANGISSPLVAQVAGALGLSASSGALWPELVVNDRLAYSLARLLVWTCPRALPAAADEGWEQYLGLWRPGKPRPADWPANWERAAAAIAAMPTA